MEFKLPFFGKKEKKSSDFLSYVIANNNYHFLDYNDPKLALEGFIKNVIANKCINVIAQQFRKCNYVLYQYSSDGKTRKEIEKSPLLDLLQRPYPTISKSAHMERLACQYLIYGENYIQRVYRNNPGKFQKTKPLFLRALAPDAVTNRPGKNGLNSEYLYHPTADDAIKFDVTILGESNLMVMRKFNPQNDFHGLSPLVPAGYSIDTHTAFSQLTYSLADNGAMPTGILTIPADRALTNEEFERIKEQVLSQSGPENAGKPKVLEGGATWTQVSINPDDMNSNETLKQQAYTIALAFGVPMELMNQEQGKFTNKQEAYEQLYEDAVLPLTSDYFDLLNAELVPIYGDNLRLEPDFSHTMVMRGREDKTMHSLEKITFLTPNEKRQIVGYEDHPEGEGLAKSAPVQAQGQTEEMKARFIADEIKAGASTDEAIELLKEIHGQ